MPQYAIMRFSKQKGGAGALEAHHERTKEKYASNPDIDTARSKYNFHIVKPAKPYLKEINSRIEAAGCRTRKDSVRFIDTLITASPDFFKGKKREDVKAYFAQAVEFLSRKSVMIIFSPQLSTWMKKRRIYIYALRLLLRTGGCRQKKLLAIEFSLPNGRILSSRIWLKLIPIWNAGNPQA